MASLEPLLPVFVRAKMKLPRCTTRLALQKQTKKAQRRHCKQKKPRRVNLLFCLSFIVLEIWVMKKSFNETSFRDVNFKFKNFGMKLIN